ncbi:hypothetical protein BSKO_04200 [Bryopsis sp. KO-2023]|nr:hypothetical protein BSKO_04200 [Bryopsis sp. KO-2023]
MVSSIASSHEEGTPMEHMASFPPEMYGPTILQLKSIPDFVNEITTQYIVQVCVISAPGQKIDDCLVVEVIHWPCRVQGLHATDKTLLRLPSFRSLFGLIETMRRS